MKNLSQALLMEANKLQQSSPWLVLFDIILTDGITTIRLVKNNENITFTGFEYIAFPIEVESTIDSSKGDIQTLVIKVSNVTRVVQAYLEEQGGMIGGSVIIRIVNADNLTEDYSELERTYDIIASNADAKYVSLTLGAPNPLSKRFPLHRYLADHCNWIFGGIECAYAGEDLTCKRTLDDCESKGNSHRFGGHIGMSSGGLRIV